MDKDKKLSVVRKDCALDFFGSPKLSGEQFCHQPQEEHLLTRSVARNIALAYDWIEFTGELEGEEIKQHPFLFHMEKKEHGTQYFKELYKITTIVHGEVLEFATLEAKPRPSFLSTKLVKVKLSNRFCYTPDIPGNIRHFLREFGIKFKHYTRIDYAIDFQSVQGFGYDVQALLHKFSARELVLKGRSMKVHSGVSEIAGITWGSRASGLSITMYNKSKEMRKKTAKPWIFELWDSAGMDKALDVYRLEFSTKKPRYDVVDEDGVTFGGHSDIEFLNNFNEQVLFLYNHFFQVAVREEGKRFSRCARYVPLVLWADATPYKPQTTCIKPQSNNIKKTVIKNIVLEAALLQHRGQKVEASYAWELAMHYVDRYSLDRWFGKVFESLKIKNSYMSHYDHLTMERIQTHKIKQATIILN